MKKINYLWFCCLLSFVALSCEQGELSPESHLSTRNDPFGFHWTGGSGGVTLHGVYNDYTATLNCDWCTVTYPSNNLGDGHPTLHLSCSENPTPERREAVLTIYTEEEAVQVQIFQNQGNPMTVSQTEFSLPADATEVSVTFQTYYPVYCSTDFYDETTYIVSTEPPFGKTLNPNRRPQWISVKTWEVASENSDNPHQQLVTLTVNANDEKTSREGCFAIYDKEDSIHPIEIKVRQSGR